MFEGFGRGLTLFINRFPNSAKFLWEFWKRCQVLHFRISRTRTNACFFGGRNLSPLIVEPHTMGFLEGVLGLAILRQSPTEQPVGRHACGEWGSREIHLGVSRRSKVKFWRKMDPLPVTRKQNTPYWNAQCGRSFWMKVERVQANDQWRGIGKMSFSPCPGLFPREDRCANPGALQAYDGNSHLRFGLLAKSRSH